MEPDPRYPGPCGKDEFCEYLEETLIPDLRDSGSDATADDFAVALWFIRNPERTVYR